MNALDLGVTFHRHNDHKLFRNESIHRALTSRSKDLKTGDTMNTDPVHGDVFNAMPWGQWKWPLTLSSVERAYLELLDEVPEKITFDLADKLMEGMSTLSPRRLQKLLLDCRSVKVKRLFLFFTDRHQHSWAKYLKRDEIDLGKGKRVLATAVSWTRSTRSRSRKTCMPLNDDYRRQVRLLLQVLPIVAHEKEFALKGGTAINLFIRDMPRLSVDIDLTYLPVASREHSLAAIDGAMARLATATGKEVKNAKVTSVKRSGDEIVTRLVVKTYDAQIKIEVTPVLRGCVYPAESRPVSAEVERQFGFAEMQVVSFSDLYAGKIMAALDRQHPRDLFDIRDLLANEGISDDLRRAFVVYLISHHRPMHEVLASPQKDITEKYESEFSGMTADPVPLDALLAARISLVEAIVGGMPAPHREFLIGFEAGTPDWSLLGLPEAAQLPAVRWRQQNLDGLDAGRRAELVIGLTAVLN